MTKLNMKMNMTQMLQIHDEETGKNSYLIEKDGKWVKATEDEYNKKIRGQQ